MEKWEAYQRFLAQNRPKTAAGVEVYDLGEGPAIVFLHGLLGDGSGWWQQLEFFKKRFRVLAPTYPEAEDLKDLAKRIIAALDELGVDRFAVVGSSLGGYLAQYLTAAYPKRVAAAVFANTFPPNEELERRYRPLVALARALPELLVKGAFYYHLVRVIVPAGDKDPLLFRYLAENIKRFDKRTLFSRYRAVVTPFAPKEPRVPHLIVESTNDPVIPESLRATLRATYPRAEIYSFTGGGHFPYLNRGDDYNRMLAAFFSSGGREARPPSRR